MPDRLVIYVIYDKDGIIDDYIPYFLEVLSPFVSRYAIVCNGKLTDGGRQKLQRFTEDIFVRPNEGYDAGAVKDVLLNLYGWDKACGYDELLICNDTFYGPLFPLSECFDKMDKLDVDFWGMTEQGELPRGRMKAGGSDLTNPPHLQSYFLNVKPRLLKSGDFRDFWNNMETSNSFYKVVYNYEISFTGYFVSKGYSYTAYVDARDILSGDAGKNYNYSVQDPVRIVKNYRCPLLKRKGLANENEYAIQFLGNENKNLLMKIIEQTTNYDINMIWDNLLRVCDVYDIRNTLHLNCVLPVRAFNSRTEPYKNRKTVVIAHLYYPGLVDECLGYLENVPAYIDRVITTPDAEIAAKVQEHFNKRGGGNTRVRLVENRGRDMSALLAGCHDILMEYDYLCFTHDKNSRYGAAGQREVESFRYLLWENTLASEAYIENVLNEFEENPRLGFLSVPRPYHGNYFTALGKGWGVNFDNVRALAEKLSLRCNLSAAKPAFSIGGAFWCRTAAMKALFGYKWEKEDFPVEPIPRDRSIVHAIERIFPYAAQHEGYYSGVMMSDTYAAVRSADYGRIISKILNNARILNNITGYKQFFNGAWVIDNDIYDFCSRYQDIYIYGAGEYAENMAVMLETEDIPYCGFIVSDGKPKPDTFFSHPVYFLSETDEMNISGSNTGVILGLDARNRTEVMPLLTERGIKNIFIMD